MLSVVTDRDRMRFYSTAQANSGESFFEAKRYRRFCDPICIVLLLIFRLGGCVVFGN